jgi:hypothetical protein
MAKYLIVLAGLLTTNCWADAYQDGVDEYARGAGATQPYEDPYMKLIPVEPSSSNRHQEESSRSKWDPVILNGPEGSRMYYPNGDGSFYQTYTK